MRAGRRRRHQLASRGHGATRTGRQELERRLDPVGGEIHRHVDGGVELRIAVREDPHDRVPRGTPGHGRAGQLEEERAGVRKAGLEHDAGQGCRAGTVGCVVPHAVEQQHRAGLTLGEHRGDVSRDRDPDAGRRAVPGVGLDRC